MPDKSCKASPQQEIDSDNYKRSRISKGFLLFNCLGKYIKTKQENAAECTNTTIVTGSRKFDHITPLLKSSVGYQ